jgi:death-on-curing protein
VLGVGADVLIRSDRVVALAQSALAAPRAAFEGAEAHPTFYEKAAVLCWHLVRNHPMPDGNKRTAYLCLREFIARNGHRWRVDPAEIADDVVSVIEGVAAGQVSREDLRRWLEEHVE